MRSVFPLLFISFASCLIYISSLYAHVSIFLKMEVLMLYKLLSVSEVITQISVSAHRKWTSHVLLALSFPLCVCVMYVYVPVCTWIMSKY